LLPNPVLLVRVPASFSVTSIQNTPSVKTFSRKNEETLDKSFQKEKKSRIESKEELHH
jgi:hypothetical protein